MEENRKSSLSVGLIIREILTSSVKITQSTDKIFPVVTDQATLPYIIYRRASMEHNPSKAGQPGADTVQVEVYVCTAAYGEGVELAEAVREELDYASVEMRGLTMRSCYLTGSSETWENDAYIQKLVFTIKA